MRTIASECVPWNLVVIHRVGALTFIFAWIRAAFVEVEFAINPVGAKSARAGVCPNFYRLISGRVRTSSAIQTWVAVAFIDINIAGATIHH
jgi:hypothetical protein